MKRSEIELGSLQSKARDRDEAKRSRGWARQGERSSRRLNAKARDRDEAKWNRAWLVASLIVTKTYFIIIDKVGLLFYNCHIRNLKILNT